MVGRPDGDDEAESRKGGACAGHPSPRGSPASVVGGDGGISSRLSATFSAIRIPRTRTRRSGSGRTRPADPGEPGTAPLTMRQTCGYHPAVPAHVGCMTAGAQTKGSRGTGAYAHTDQSVKTGTGTSRGDVGEFARYQRKCRTALVNAATRWPGEDASARDRRDSRPGHPANIAEYRGTRRRRSDDREALVARRKLPPRRFSTCVGPST